MANFYTWPCCLFSSKQDAVYEFGIISVLIWWSLLLDSWSHNRWCVYCTFLEGASDCVLKRWMFYFVDIILSSSFFSCFVGFFISGYVFLYGYPKKVIERRVREEALSWIFFIISFKINVSFKNYILVKKI